MRHHNSTNLQFPSPRSALKTGRPLVIRSRTVSWVLSGRMGAQNPHGPVIGWGLPNQRKKERKKLWSIVRLNWTELIVSSPPGHKQRGGASPPDHGRAAAATLFVFSRALAVAYTILRQWWDPAPDLRVTSTHHPSSPQHFTPASWSDFMQVPWSHFL